MEALAFHKAIFTDISRKLSENSKNLDDSLSITENMGYELFFLCPVSVREIFDSLRSLSINGREHFWNHKLED